MGRAPCCDKANVKKGPWSPEEDAKLKAYIDQNGTGGNWIALPQKIGLKRCGKSCRLRWLNYLRPNLKHGGFSDEEDNIICSLYMSIGSRWSIIAAQLPGRTDNDIKNYWNTRLKKKLLGKQRKEARRTATLIKKQDHDESMMKMSSTSSTHDDHNYFMAVPAAVGHGSMMMMMMNPNQTPYWHYPTHDLPPPPPPAMIMPDNLIHNNQDSIKNLLIKLGGKFSKEPNTFDPNESINYSNNMVSCATYDSQFPSPQYDPYILQEPDHNSTIYNDDPVELFYGDEQLQVLDSNFYGINNMINGGSTVTGTSSSENSSNYVISPLDFPTNNYEAGCQQQLQQDQSRYCFGLQ